MRIAFIGCMVLNREISHEIAQTSNICRTFWLRQGLHDTPEKLRLCLQNKIDEIEKENSELPSTNRFEAICLGYGLCSNGVIGLKSRSLPLVIPRCDDCISLFLGSAERYRKLFNSFTGAYWYNSGWIEQAFTPSEENYNLKRLEYEELYGEENTDFLMENETAWAKNYKNCVYITCPIHENCEHEAYCKEASKHFGWTYHKEIGDMSFIRSLINGPWDDERFLVCAPSNTVEADYSDKKIRAVPISE